MQKGHDEKWFYTCTKKFKRSTDLSGGAYVLRIKGAIMMESLMRNHTPEDLKRADTFMRVVIKNDMCRNQLTAGT